MGECENYNPVDRVRCADLFNCCNCGWTIDESPYGCGCHGCWSCNACETCLNDEGDEND